MEPLRQIVAALNGTRPEVLDIETAWQEFLQQDLERYKRHRAECWDLLCKHYGIPTIPNVAASDAGKLAAALAEQHVPGFQVRRAVELRLAAKKPIKLDVERSICLFFLIHFEFIRKVSSLKSDKERWAERFRNEVEVSVAKESIRKYRQQMLSAHKAYADGHPNDFQRKFVEEVEPMIIRIFKEAWAAPRSVRECNQPTVFNRIH